jgi:hypothetical protein
MIARFTMVLAILGLMLLASCGGGGGTLASGGIGGTGISSGTVTAFGSIFVNGVEFDTSNAVFTRDDQSATEADFSVGEVVTVIGNFDTDRGTGVAEQVMFEAVVSGAITDVSSAGDGRIEVLGQTLLITPATVFENFTDVSELSAGNVLEISGFANADGSITATHIAKEREQFVAGVSNSEVRGIVTDLNEGAMTFTIDGLTVDYSAPQLLDGVLANGSFVEVESDSNVVDGVLRADIVRVTEPAPSVSEGVSLKQEGVVTRFAAPSDFDVGSQPVTITGETEFEDGVIEDLGLNVALEVDGVVNASGVLVADRIVFRLPDDLFEIDGIALAVDAAAGTVTLLSADDGPTIVVSVDARTRFIDDSDLQLRPFGLADIATGDQLEIAAFGSGDDITAIRIEREDATAIPPPAPDPPPVPDPDPVPTPTPDPEPSPGPDPSPDPVPDPEPIPGPDPDPVPDPGPIPDPTPSPDPGPIPGPDPDPTPIPDDGDDAGGNGDGDNGGGNGGINGIDD